MSHLVFLPLSPRGLAGVSEDTLSLELLLSIIVAISMVSSISFWFSTLRLCILLRLVTRSMLAHALQWRHVLAFLSSLSAWCVSSLNWWG